MHSDFRLFPAGAWGHPLASLSEAGGDVLLQSASKPLPPHSPSSTKRHFWNAPSLPILQVARQFPGLARYEQAPRNQCIYLSSYTRARGKHFQKGTPATAPIPHREKPVSARGLLGPPNACLNPARRIRARAIELSAHDFRALDDSGCRTPSPGHMMVVPHVSCQWR